MVLFPWTPRQMLPYPVIYIKVAVPLILPTIASFLLYEPALSVFALIYERFQLTKITIPFLFIKANPHKDTFICRLVMLP